MEPVATERKRTYPTLPPVKSRFRMPVDDLAWLGLVVAVAALAVAFALISPLLAKLYPAPAHDVFGEWRGLIAPEPREDVRSMLALAAPFALAAIVLALGSRKPPRQQLDLAVIAIQAIGIGMLVWAVLEQTRSGPLLPPEYFDPLLLSVPNLLIGTAIGLVLTGVVLRPPHWLSGDTARRLGDRARGWRWVPLGIAIAATVIWLLPALVTDSTVGQSGRLAAGHIPVQAEDYFSVVNGRTPLVNYIAQYANLLPIALAPALAAFDSSITSYSIAMCSLSLLGMLAIFGVFRQVTRGPWAALALYVPWTALSLFPWNDIGPFREFNGIYYAVFPGRYFGPFVLAWLCALSTRRRIPIWALFGFAGLVALNNFEFGSAALLGLIMAKAVSWDRSESLRERVRRLAVQGVAGVLAALAIVCAITLVRTGQLPDPTLLTYYNRLFLSSSYGLEPMPALGLHWALYATYAAAILIAAVRYVRNDPDRTLTAMLAFSGAFGLASGMYFVGRSSQFQLMLLFPAWGLALALVAWTAAGSLRAAATDPARLCRLLLPGCAALVGLGVMISAIDRVPPPWRQIDRLSGGDHAEGRALDAQRAANEGQAEAQRYVEANTHPGERVLIIGTGEEHRVAERAGVVNVSPLNSITSLVSPAEADRALNQLQDEGGALVFEGVSALPQGAFVFGIPELATILRERGYRLVGSDPDINFRLWRRTTT
jgi:hypothetical protein